MPPKKRFSKEDIVNAAFELASKKGFSISARDVAASLNCSVAPIYFNFETMEELLKAVIEKIFAISEQFMQKHKGKNLFEMLGRGSLDFARTYPIFFREFVINKSPYMPPYDIIEKEMVKALEDDEEMGHLDYEDRRKLLFKMRVFQMGISTMIVNDNLPKWLNSIDAENILFEVGEELIYSANNNKTEG